MSVEKVKEYFTPMTPAWYLVRVRQSRVQEFRNLCRIPNVDLSNCCCETPLLTGLTSVPIPWRFGISVIVDLAWQRCTCSTSEFNLAIKKVRLGFGFRNK